MRTFQHNRPFDGLSVLENVLVGAHTRFRRNPFSRKASLEETEQCRRAEELVRFVGLGELRDAPVERLSFGQGRLWRSRVRLPASRSSCSSTSRRRG